MWPVQAKQLLADTLSPLLVPGNPRGVGGRAIQGFQGAHQSPPGLPRSNLVPQQHSIQDAQLNPHNDEVPIDDQVYTKLELTKHEAAKPIYMTTLVFEWPCLCSWFRVPALPHHTAGASPRKDDPRHRPSCKVFESASTLGRTGGVQLMIDFCARFHWYIYENWIVQLFFGSSI